MTITFFRQVYPAAPGNNMALLSSLSEPPDYGYMPCLECTKICTHQGPGGLSQTDQALDLRTVKTEFQFKVPEAPSVPPRCRTPFMICDIMIERPKFLAIPPLTGIPPERRRTRFLLDRKVTQPLPPVLPPVLGYPWMYRALDLPPDVKTPLGNFEIRETKLTSSKRPVSL